jgi:asparagine synthase (glutamine-hydrolysing)
MAYDFLVFGLVDHTNDTFFDGIHSVSAGHWLTVEFDGSVSTYPYWTLPVNESDEPFSVDLARRSTEMIQGLLTSAVQIRLRSDVPVGFCLSGGLDSSTIVTIADKLIKEIPLSQVGAILHTFTGYFDDKALDEREFAYEVENQTSVHSHKFSPSSDAFFADFDRMLWHQEQPFGGPSVFLQYHLMQQVSMAGIRVILDGQGGDELFGGYFRYHGVHFRGLLRNLKLKQTLEALQTMEFVMLKHAAYQMLTANLPNRLAKPIARKTGPNLHWFCPEYLASLKSREDAWFAGLPNGRLNDVLANDLTRLSLPKLLRFEDRNSMAFSIEARTPYADDHPLIEYLSTLPGSIKFHSSVSKYLLREAMVEILPEKVRLRRSKLGYSVPQQAWVRELEANGLMQRLMDWDNPYTTKDSLRDLGESAWENSKDTQLLWKLLELKRWEDMFLGNLSMKHSSH